jgi:hypothetical protein
VIVDDVGTERSVPTRSELVMKRECEREQP